MALRFGKFMFEVCVKILIKIPGKIVTLFFINYVLVKTCKRKHFNSRDKVFCILITEIQRKRYKVNYYMKT